MPDDRPTGVPADAKRQRQPDYSMWIVGEDRAVLRDAYHTFLNASWPIAFGLLAVGFFVANVVFAVVYMVVGGVDGANRDSFMDALSFSVQTMATIGYGVMHPASNGATTVMIVESMVGIIVTALATGLVFAKFSRATARVAFSKFAVITPHEGVPSLIFRMGNRRSSVIVDAQLHAVVSMTRKTKEGETFYGAHDLKLVRERLVGMARGWTAIHTITETSPLYGLDSAALKAAECEISISMTGIDSVSTQQVHAVHTYADGHIKYGFRLADTIKPLPNGDLVLNLLLFDDIVPDSTPRDSVPPP